MDPTYRRYFKTVSLIWAACIGILALLYVFALLPQEKTIANTEAELTGKKFEYKVAQSDGGEKIRAYLRQQLEDSENDLSNYATDLAEAGQLQLAITQAIREIGVGMFRNLGKTAEAYAKIDNCYYIGEIYFTVSFTADFKQFVRLINVLERHKPVVFVDKFRIVRSRKAQQTHKVEMTLSIFVKKPPEEQGTGDVNKDRQTDTSASQNVSELESLVR